MHVEDICCQRPVISVIVIDDLDQAVPLAETLVEAGLRVPEITLPTPIALAAIETIATAVPQAILGAGTIRGAQDIAAARAAGAVFLTSAPAHTPTCARRSCPTAYPSCQGAPPRPRR